MQKEQPAQEAAAAAKTKGKSETGKTRQFHTRSRAGCVVCRQRHVRCDETRPFCTNCVTAKRCCEYTPAKIPLRERRAQERQPLQPGEQKPWVCWEMQQDMQLEQRPSSPPPSTSSIVLLNTSPSPTPWQAVPGPTAADPFNTMVINMQYKSKELFHYFCQMGGYSGRDHQEISLRSLTEDPASLRNTLLLAGLHYAWNKGTLDSFESTFLYHKIESIRTVNRWLRDLKVKTAKMCIRQIATLCFAEYCLGNEDAAEAHLQAIVAFLDMKDPKPSRKEVDEEFVNRYLLVSYYFLLGFKEKAEDVPAEPHHVHRSAADEAACLKSLQSRTGETRLKVLHLLPTFLSGPQSYEGLRDVDGRPILEALREATIDCDQRQVDKLLSSPSSMKIERVTCAMRRHFMSMTCRVLSAADQIVKNVDTRSSKLPPSPPASLSSSPSSSAKTAPRKPMIASLTGIGTAAALFLHSVLENYNGGFPVDMRLHTAVLLILRRDLTLCEDRNLRQDMMSASGETANRDFWFWRVFAGAFSLAKAMEVALAAAAGATDLMAEAETRGMVKDLQDLEFCYDGFIQRYSEATGVLEWREAREVLAKVVWPEFEPSENMAQGLWERAVGWPYPVASTGVGMESSTVTVGGSMTGIEDALEMGMSFDSLYD
ncbi:Sterol regulatory element-binding protein [Paramyrothecium foliicola]|nr:Sterol regulatory element-binding protein [Paramyrothecium foliicola]